MKSSLTLLIVAFATICNATLPQTGRNWQDQLRNARELATKLQSRTQQKESLAEDTKRLIEEFVDSEKAARAVGNSVGDLKKRFASLHAEDCGSFECLQRREVLGQLQRISRHTDKTSLRNKRQWGRPSSHFSDARNGKYYGRDNRDLRGVTKNIRGYLQELKDTYDQMKRSWENQRETKELGRHPIFGSEKSKRSKKHPIWGDLSERSPAIHPHAGKEIEVEVEVEVEDSNQNDNEKENPEKKPADDTKGKVHNAYKTVNNQHQLKRQFGLGASYCTGFDCRRKRENELKKRIDLVNANKKKRASAFYAQLEKLKRQFGLGASYCTGFDCKKK